MCKYSSITHLKNPIHLQLPLALFPKSIPNSTPSMVAFYFVNLAKSELYFQEFLWVTFWHKRNLQEISLSKAKRQPLKSKGQYRVPWQFTYIVTVWLVGSPSWSRAAAGPRASPAPSKSPLLSSPRPGSGTRGRSPVTLSWRLWEIDVIPICPQYPLLHVQLFFSTPGPTDFSVLRPPLDREAPAFQRLLYLLPQLCKV